MKKKIRCEICYEIINRPSLRESGQFICENCYHGNGSNGGIGAESCVNKSIKYKEIQEGWEDDRVAQIYEDYINR